MRNEAEVDSAGFSDIIFNQAAMNRRFMLIEPSYKINSDDNSKSPSPSPGQKSEERDLQEEPSETKAETENNGSAPVLISNAKKEKQKTALGSNSSTGTKGSPTSTSDQPVAQKSEEKKKESVGDSNKAEKDEVYDDEGTTEQTLKSKARQVTEKSSGDSKARDSGGSGTSSFLEENLVLGVALDGSKRTLPIDEEVKASGALMDSEELGIGSEWVDGEEVQKNLCSKQFNASVESNKQKWRNERDSVNFFNRRGLRHFISVNNTSDSKTKK